MFKRVLGNPRPKNLARNIAVRLVARLFDRSDNLNRHRRVHSGEKPFECSRCEKKFSDKSALNRHLKAHEKRVAEHTYTCGTCGQTFHNRAPYNAHIRTAHSTAQPTRKRPATKKNTDATAAKKSKRTDQTSANTASEPSATLQASTATAGSSWEADPLLIPTNLVPSSEENIADVYRQHWPQIRTRFSRQNRLQDWYTRLVQFPPVDDQSC